MPKHSLVLLLLLTCLQVSWLSLDTKAQVVCRITSMDHPKEIIGLRRLTVRITVEYSFPYYAYSLKIKMLEGNFRSDFHDADTVAMSEAVDVYGSGSRTFSVELTAPSSSKEWTIWAYACYTRPQLEKWYYAGKDGGYRSFSVLVYTKSQVRLMTSPNEAVRYAKIAGGGEQDAGTFVTLKVDGIVQGPSGTRYLFVSWIVEGRRYYTETHRILVERREVTVTAEFKVQYVLVVMSELGDPQGSGWYDEGSAASFSVTTPVPAGVGVRQVFERWSGDSTSASPSSTVVMDSPKTIVAVWRTDRTVLYLMVLGVFGACAVVAGLIVRVSRQRKAAAPAGPVGVVHHEAASPGVAKPVPEAAPAVKQVKEVKEVPALKVTQITEVVSAVDEKVFSYIVEHQGEISLSQASQDLGVSVDELKAAIDRLRSQGRLA